MTTRKLAEVWQVGDDYQIRVIVGAFQRGLTADPQQAEEIASYEVIEVLRKILAEADAGTAQYASDDSLPPRDDR